jgi:hypothetical protein
MTEERAAAIERIAQEALHRALQPKLMALKSREDVTAERLEDLVVEAVDEVGVAALAALWDLDAWVEHATKAAAWTCPCCGKQSPRAKDTQGTELWETGPLQSTQGEVRWHAPLFYCAACRRRFSPLTPPL